MLSSVEILILAAIQGVSEFIPVSSSSHIVLVSNYYEFANQNLLIDICLHLGSLIAIIIFFRKELFSFIKNKIKVPMHRKTRSLNVAMTVAIVASEALRQNNFLPS